MSQFAISNLFAAAGQQTQPNPTGQMFQTIIMMVFFIVIFYFILIRPQQKKAKDHAALLKTLGHGDKVVTSGGIVGVIVGLKEKTVSVRTADTKIEVLKSAVSEITEKSNGKSEQKEP